MIIDPWFQIILVLIIQDVIMAIKSNVLDIDTHFQTMTDKTFLQARRLSKLCIENVFRYSEWIIIIQSIGKGQD